MNAHGPACVTTPLPCGCPAGFARCPSCKRPHAAAMAERTRADRPTVAVAMLEACGLPVLARLLRDGPTETHLRMARGEVRRTIDLFYDGSDPTRLAAFMTARSALGRLWEVM